MVNRDNDGILLQLEAILREKMKHHFAEMKNRFKVNDPEGKGNVTKWVEFVSQDGEQGVPDNMDTYCYFIFLFDDVIPFVFQS